MTTLGKLAEKWRREMPGEAACREGSEGVSWVAGVCVDHITELEAALRDVIVIPKTERSAVADRVSVGDAPSGYPLNADSAEFVGAGLVLEDPNTIVDEPTARVLTELLAWSKRPTTIGIPANLAAAINAWPEDNAVRQAIEEDLFNGDTLPDPGAAGLCDQLARAVAASNKLAGLVIAVLEGGPGKYRAATELCAIVEAAEVSDTEEDSDAG